MRRVSLLAVLLLALPVGAVIIRLTALSELVAESTFIVEAKITALELKRPSLILEVTRVLQGKTEAKKWPVLIGEGDAGAQKRKEVPQLLERVGEDLPVVVFVSQRDKEYVGFVYTEGTWFSLEGQTVDGEVRWRFAHLEPYLRRTFSGTTAELRKLLEAGKGYPKPDAKGKPGLGPPLKKATGQAPRPESVPHLGVIPMVVVGGPLALLALLFPSVFAGWDRWLALLCTAGTASTLLLLHWLFYEWVGGTWLATPVAVWTLMGLVHLGGFFWAMQRHTTRVKTGAAPLLPGVLEITLLGGMALFALAGLITLSVGMNQRLLTPDWWPLLTYGLALILTTVYVLALRICGPRLQPAVSSEAILLGALVGVSLPLGPLLVPVRVVMGSSLPPTEALREINLRWTFQLPERGAIVSSPLVAGDRVYIAAAHDSVFRPYGRLYCLNRATGEVIWKFDNGNKMRQAFSTPVIAAGTLYIGEGLHQDDQCRLYALDPSTGEKKGEFATGSHTEATPVVVGDRIYQGAGDDGLYCLDRPTLQKVWNFGGFHFDTGPIVVGDGVFVGCGIGDAFKETALFRIDARNGKAVWRIATDLPIWTEVAVVGERVFAGMGNGRLNEEPETPLGRVICLDARTGNERWKVKLPDGVLGRLTAEGGLLYFGCRDGAFYCLSQQDGSIRWKRDLGNPIVAGAGVDAPPGEMPSRLYVVSVAGLLAALDPLSGSMVWSKNLVDDGVKAEVISTPAVVRDGHKRQIFVGLTVISTARTGELRCYEE
jgi:outer membrane protein assembly factor BamB